MFSGITHKRRDVEKLPSQKDVMAPVSSFYQEKLNTSFFLTTAVIRSSLSIAKSRTLFNAKL